MIVQLFNEKRELIFKGENTDKQMIELTTGKKINLENSQGILSIYLLGDSNED